MSESAGNVRWRIALVSTSSLWVAGFQGLFCDPCGVETYVVSLTEALSLKGLETVLIDASATSVEGRLREVLLQFRNWAPNLRPIVISHESRDDDEQIERLIHAGAKGYLNASASTDEFRVALENVREGSIWAPRRVLSRLVQGNRVGERGRVVKCGVVTFTPREDEVLRMLMGGRGNREIGASLGIDPVTVKAHLGRIMRKAGVGNRIELTMFALNQTRSEGQKSEPKVARPKSDTATGPQIMN